MSASAIEKIIMHKRQSELLFGAAVMRNSFRQDEINQEAGWLRPEQIQDEDISRFWGMVQGGRLPEQAALDCGILRKLAAFDDGFIPLFGRTGVYAQSIADDEYLIRSVQTAQEIAGLAAERQIEEVKAKIAKLGSIAPTGNIDIQDSTDIGLRFMETLDEENHVIKTGIGPIDRATGGISRKTLTLLAARPSMGKTTMALRWAVWQASQGLNVLMFSLEMAKEQLWEKLICSAAGVPTEIYKSRTFTDAQRERIKEAQNKLTDDLGGRMRVDDSTVRDSAYIWQACAQYRPDVLYVDHLALVKDKDDSEVKRLGNISKSGKAIAKEFNLSAIYLMQLNRGVTGRTDKRPGLADLRGSGELEEDADNVFFIHREDYYTGGPVEVSPTDLIVSKNREGIKDDCAKMFFNLPKQNFYGKGEEPK